MQNEEQEFISQLLASPNKAEALSWLQAGSPDSFRNVGELPTNEASVEFIKNIYAAGAEEVMAVEIDAYPDGQNTGRLVVTVPEDSERRKSLFRWCANQARGMGYDPVEDYGQRHVFIMLD